MMMKMNKDIHLIIQARQCPYWNYENQTCKHTCRGCDNLSQGNTIDTICCGVMIDGDRYCMLDYDINAEIIKSLERKENIKKYKALFDELLYDIETNGLIK